MTLAARRAAALAALARRQPRAGQVPAGTRPSGPMPTDWREAVAWLDARDRIEAGEEPPPG